MDQVQPPPLDDTVKQKVALFVSYILEKDGKSGRILYRNLDYDSSSDMYVPSPPPSFIALARISEHLRNGGFYDTLQDATSYVLCEEVVGQIRTGIVNFISRLEQCIDFVENSDHIRDLEPYLNSHGTTTLPIFQGQSTLREHSTRNSTRATTWNSYVSEWKYAVGQWRQYLVLFDTIYPGVFHQDTLEVMALIINRYPTLLLMP